MTADLCADQVTVGGGVLSPDGRRRRPRADPILAAAVTRVFRPAAFGGQQNALFCA